MTQMPTTLEADSASTSVALDPVYSILNSMALLNEIEQLPALPAWIQRAAAQLTPTQRRINRLVFEALQGALVLPDTPPDFPAYLAALQAREPDAVREHATTSLDQPWLLDALPPDAGQLREAQALLERPIELHSLIIEHLRELWNTLFAAEWPRLERDMQNQVNLLTRGLPQHETVTPERIVQNLYALLGRAVPTGAERIVFVLSPHVGRYVTRSLQAGTLRLFFHAPRFFGVLFRAGPVGMPELLGRLSALNDETRLNILTLFATRDQITAQELIDELELTQSTTSRALKQLGAFLQNGRDGDGKKTYTLMPAQIDFTLNAVKHLLEPAAAPQPQLSGDHPPELRRFLDARERVTTWPSKQKDRLLVLDYLASKFEPDVQFSEKEVNAIISRYHAYNDHATLRRELYDYGYLHRERDGSRYWRVEEPLPDELKRQPWPRNVVTGSSVSTSEQ